MIKACDGLANRHGLSDSHPASGLNGNRAHAPFSAAAAGAAISGPPGAAGAGIAAGSGPVGSRAAHGALSTVLFAALNKVVTFVTQIGLAWFLVPEEFGLVAMTLSVMSVSALFGGATLRTVLIQKSDRFEQAAGQVFWLGLILNLLTAGLLAATSPIAAALFREPRVVPLILVAAIAPPIQSLSIIYAAALNRSLQFSSLARIQFLGGLAQNIFGLVLAAAGAGALALIVPLTLNAIVAGVLYRHAAGALPLGRPQPRQWREFQGPVLWLMLHTFCVALQTAGPNFVLGLVEHDANTTGYYYWGFSLAAQAIFLLVTNLQSVLFPALHQLNHDHGRQATAVEKACGTLTLVMLPVILLQALLAGPFVKLFFAERWAPSIPVVQWISLGLLTQPVGLMAISVLMARGQFKQLAGISALIAISLTLAAGTGAAVGTHVDTAQWTGVTLLVVNLAAGGLAWRGLGCNGFGLVGKVLPLLALGIPLGLIGAWTGRLVAPRGPVPHLILVTLVVAVLYLGLVKLFQPRLLQDLLLRLQARSGPMADGPADLPSTELRP
ncbi:MAG TPA: oligosaccharide flippase family protein [Verrucomicrobiae bacterium]|nr:oligosaccharide flippase family protein [Verrucomicrobiae bacterium]